RRTHWIRTIDALRSGDFDLCRGQPDASMMRSHYFGGTLRTEQHRWRLGTTARAAGSLWPAVPACPENCPRRRSVSSGTWPAPSWHRGQGGGRERSVLRENAGRRQFPNERDGAKRPRVLPRGLSLKAVEIGLGVDVEPRGKHVHPEAAAVGSLELETKNVLCARCTRSEQHGSW